ncbi:hypothetical protein TNCV_4553721 [Trichonephila clavipes]|nr:hypothetical protein TNCV_4553721 [Trichonephila clavipes]
MEICSGADATHDVATRGLLATDHVILNHGQVTWTTPELAPPLLTTTPYQREEVRDSTYIKSIGCLYTAGFQLYWVRTHDKLDRLDSNLVAKWPGLINRRGVIFHHNNVRLHATAITHRKLWAMIGMFHPSLLIDCHLFRVLSNSFTQKTLDDLDALKTAIQYFFDSKQQDFTTVGFFFYQKNGKRS